MLRHPGASHDGDASPAQRAPASTLDGRRFALYYNTTVTRHCEGYGKSMEAEHTVGWGVGIPNHNEGQRCGEEFMQARNSGGAGDGSQAVRLWLSSLKPREAPEHTPRV